MSRHPISKQEQSDLGELRERIACLLADCGFSEAVPFCLHPPHQPSPKLGTPAGFPVDLESIVSRVIQSLATGTGNRSSVF